MATKSGAIVYKIYRALTYGLSPLIRLHLRWRKLRGLEHAVRWRERLGRPSARRPNGHLIWLHAVSLGEGLAAIPVIKCCLDKRPDVTVLMTTTTVSAFEVIKNRLPCDVIYQFAPLDIPASMDAFLHYWRPDAVMLVESELWPNLIMGAARDGIALALLNGRISTKSFQNWSQPVILPLISLILSKFSLILPLSTIQGIRFQLLQAPPSIIHFSGDLKFAIEDLDISERDKESLEEFQAQLSCRKVWMASSIHKGEEKGISGDIFASNYILDTSNKTPLLWPQVPLKILNMTLLVFIGAHKVLKQKHPDILTIIVPRQPQHGRDLALKLQEEGVSVALRSHDDKLTPRTEIFVVDSLGELRNFYRLTPIAVIGGSFLPESAGHNISEAAAAGCAVLTGHHIAHFSPMVLEMQKVNSLSVLQISGEKLEEAVHELFDNVKILEARRAAAKQAYRTLSRGIVGNFWKELEYNIFKKFAPDESCEAENLCIKEKL